MSVATLIAMVFAAPPSPLASAWSRRRCAGSGSRFAALLMPAASCSIRLSPVGHWPTALRAAEVTLVTNHADGSPAVRWNSR
jgi:hypothetical protein